MLNYQRVPGGRNLQKASYVPQTQIFPAWNIHKSTNPHKIIVLSSLQELASTMPKLSLMTWTKILFQYTSFMQTRRNHLDHHIDIRLSMCIHIYTHVNRHVITLDGKYLLDTKPPGVKLDDNKQHDLSTCLCQRSQAVGGARRVGDHSKILGGQR